MDHKKPWVIILNWNGKDRLPVSLGALSRMKGDFHLLVVDNGSTDGSLETIPDLYSKPYDVLENGSNLGFAGGNNPAIDHALKHGATHVALINDDLAVDEDWLEQMLRHVARHPNAGICGGTIYFLDRPGHINSTGIALDRHFRAPDENFDRLASEVKLEASTKPAVSGGAMFIDSRVIRKIGLLDDSFFAYFEDVDLCLRAKEEGFEVWYVPEATSKHMYGGAFGDHSAFKRFLLARNHSWLAAKHQPPLVALVALPLYFLYRCLVLAPKTLLAEGFKAAIAEWRGAFWGLFGGYRRIFRRALT